MIARLRLAMGVAVAATLTLAIPSRTQQSAGNVAFVNVTVIPMDRERILEGQTVLVRDGVIQAVSPTARQPAPAGYTVIDGRGKYLMPGLAEMHAHIPGGNATEQLIRDIMFLYVANGVTTIRGMLGAPNQLALRDRTARGEMLGPTIFVGAPSLNGQSASTPEAGAALVRQHKTAGYDFLKLHPGLTRPVYDTIVATARSAGITFAGHISANVGLERTLAARQSTIDHLDGYLEASASPALRAQLMNGQVPLGQWIHTVDSARVRYWAGRTRQAGTWNVPTAYLWESFYSAEPAESAAQRPEMRYASPQMVNGWVQQKNGMTRAQQTQAIGPADVAKYLGLRRLTLRALADSGARVLLGTDSPQMFNVPGFSLHREVALMREVGLTPYQILSSGTRNVALYAAEDLKLDGRFGVVAAGNRADLVLLDANPLLDVRNLARRTGVMVRGRWNDAAAIQRGLEEMANRYRPAP